MDWFYITIIIILLAVMYLGYLWFKWRIVALEADLSTMTNLHKIAFDDAITAKIRCAHLENPWIKIRKDGPTPKDQEEVLVTIRRGQSYEVVFAKYDAWDGWKLRVPIPDEFVAWMSKPKAFEE